MDNGGNSSHELEVKKQKEKETAKKEAEKLGGVIKPLSELSQFFIKEIDDKGYSPESIFEVPSKEKIRKVLGSMVKPIPSCFQRSDETGNLVGCIPPTISLGNIILAGARFDLEGSENRDQLANAMVNEYINNKNEKEKNLTRLNNVKYCQELLGEVEALKGSVHQLAKLHVKSNDMNGLENLQGVREGILVGYKKAKEDLKISIESLPPNDRTMVERLIRQLDRNVQNEILEPLKLEEQELEKNLDAQVKIENGLEKIVEFKKKLEENKSTLKEGKDSVLINTINPAITNTEKVLTRLTELQKELKNTRKTVLELKGINKSIDSLQRRMQELQEVMVFLNRFSQEQGDKEISDLHMYSDAFKLSVKYLNEFDLNKTTGKTSQNYFQFKTAQEFAKIDSSQAQHETNKTQENIEKHIKDCDKYLIPLQLDPTKKTEVDQLVVPAIQKIKIRLMEKNKELQFAAPPKSPKELELIKFEVYQLNEKYKEVMKVAEFLKFCKQNQFSEGGDKWVKVLSMAMYEAESFLKNVAGNDINSVIKNDDLHYFEQMINQIKPGKPPVAVFKDIAKEYASGRAKKLKDEKEYGREETSKYWKEEKTQRDKENLAFMAMEEQAFKELKNSKKKTKMGEAGNTSAEQMAKKLLSSYVGIMDSAENYHVFVTQKLKDQLENLQSRANEATELHEFSGIHAEARDLEREFNTIKKDTSEARKQSDATKASIINPTVEPAKIVPKSPLKVGFFTRLANLFTRKANYDAARDAMREAAREAGVTAAREAVMNARVRQPETATEKLARLMKASEKKPNKETQIKAGPPYTPTAAAYAQPAPQQHKATAPTANQDPAPLTPETEPPRSGQPNNKK